MKRYSAQYIITNVGQVLKRAVVSTEDDGTVVSVTKSDEETPEPHSTEYHNGIIIPGFVNCHCHLELSHMKNKVEGGKGLGEFIQAVRTTRDDKSDNPCASAIASDKQLYDEGTVLCADICNTSDTFDIKKRSRIKYLNLLEVFGIDPAKADRRFNDIVRVAEAAREMDLPYYFVPHSAYSMSLSLLRLLKMNSSGNKVTSIHFMESASEALFLKNHSGPLMTSYLNSGLLPERLETAGSHSDVILNELTTSGNLILVHNTFADASTIDAVKKRGNLFWCLCPNSNIRIEKILPPVQLLLEEGCELVIGTDSLASNASLSILEELKTLQVNSPDLPLEDLVRWATINGAKALAEDQQFGSIEPGKKPGLLLLEDVDLLNMKLLPDSSVRRLI